MPSSDVIRDEVINFCSDIGADPMLVQGAGGNVSWKDGNTLWVKASGAWLSDAKVKNIFVAVDLNDLQDAIKDGNFNIVPKVKGGSGSILKPSIETLLHALLNYRVIVHVHSIDALNYLVRNDPELEISKKLKIDIPWSLIEYKKPGSHLAKAVSNAINNNSATQIMFLQNHGIIIGGSDINEVSNILSNLVSELRVEPLFNKPLSESPKPILFSHEQQFIPIDNLEIHNLALVPALFERLKTDWALYPDHIVFLGSKPHCYDTIEMLFKDLEDEVFPELFFLKGKGVFTTPDVGEAKFAQLKCYYDVLVRQNNDASVRTLDEQEILELLDWDAEEYRKSLAK